MMNTVAPVFLLKKPLAPQIKQRQYNGRKLLVWEGRTKLASINGWVDNPRIELATKGLREKIGSRPLTQDEVYELMKGEPDVRLKELRDDILQNGLRVPLTLSHTGKLLDGNRRFFALKFALEGMDPADPNRQDLELIDVYVLTDAASEEDEHHVLVEENFSASLKIEWPDYVKALMVVNAYEEEGLTAKQIAKKFNWKPGKVNETLRIHEIISQFEVFATSAKDEEDEHGGGLGLSEREAQFIAARHYQYFNEAQKSFLEPLRTDIEFKLQFFRWIAEQKFSNFGEVRVAYKAWQDPEAKAALMQDEPSAAKAAKAILDYNSRVVKNKDEAIIRIETFAKFLRNMTAEELKLLPASAQKALRESLDLVIKMSQAASKA